MAASPKAQHAWQEVGRRTTLDLNLCSKCRFRNYFVVVELVPSVDGRLFPRHQQSEASDSPPVLNNDTHTGITWHFKR